MFFFSLQEHIIAVMIASPYIYGKGDLRTSFYANTEKNMTTLPNLNAADISEHRPTLPIANSKYPEI